MFHHCLSAVLFHGVQIELGLNVDIAVVPSEGVDRVRDGMGQKKLEPNSLPLPLALSK